ncbi:MAG: hypothetical protein OEV59_09625 [Deltaproteobacteria bacterium]|nr:hypothetical protein [Deltaproteobacteria bacterium]
MKDLKMITIEINDESALYKAFDILHDARFCLPKAVYNQNDGTWSAVFEREYFEQEGAVRQDKKFLFFRRYTFPLVECTVVLRNLCDLQVKDKSNIENYMFNEIQKHKDGYSLVFCEGMEIDLKFNNEPFGRLQDMRVLEKEGSIWSWGRMFKDL